MNRARRVTRLTTMTLPALLVLLAAPPAFAQTIAGDSLPPAATARGGTFLDVTTDPPGATIYLDSVDLGNSPLVIRLPEPPRRGAQEPHILIVVGGKPGSWFAPVVTDTIRAPEGGGVDASAVSWGVDSNAVPADGDTTVDADADTGRGFPDTLSRHYVLPLSARIASDPPGAGVVLGDSIIGNTPLFASLPRSVATVRLVKDGYREAAVLIDPATFNYRVGLVRNDSGAAPAADPLAGVTGKGSTMLIVAAVATVAAGTTAALVKHKADALYEDYQDTGDPSTLDRVRRLDLASAIALAVAEIGIGYLVIELLSR
jgi:hypothetical protein